jgi:hypothetical protein
MIKIMHDQGLCAEKIPETGKKIKIFDLFLKIDGKWNEN